MKNKKLLILIPALMLTFGGLSTLVSCGPTEQDVKVTSVTLNKTELSLEVGASETLTWTIAPDNATNKGLTWTVAPEGYATVSALGKVTGSAVGECVVTATAKDGSGKFASCAVTVVDTASAYATDLPVVTFDAAKAATPQSGDSAKMMVVGKLGAITQTTYGNSTLTQPGSEDVLTVYGMYDTNGKRYDAEDVAVKPVENDIVVLEGVFCFYGSSKTWEIKNAVVRQCQGTVYNYPAPTDISLPETKSIALSDGDVQMTVTSTPATADLTGLAWSTDDANGEVLTISATGLIHPVAAGTKNVTASIGELSATCAVTVTAEDPYATELPVVSFAAAKEATPASGNSEKMMVVGKLGAITQATYGNSTLTQPGSEETLTVYGMYDVLGTQYGSIADADKKPVEGDYVVLEGQFTMYNGTKWEILNAVIRQLNGTVFNYPELESIVLGPANAEVKEGSTLTLTVTPNAGVTVALTDFTWESSAPAVASVEDGVVTGVAHSDNPVTITATHKEKTAVTATLQVTCVEDSGQDSYLKVAKYDFSTNTATDTISDNSGALKDMFTSFVVTGDGLSDIVSTTSNETKCYKGYNGHTSKGLKFGTSSANGSFKVQTSQNITRVIVVTAGWLATDTLAVGDAAAQTMGAAYTADDALKTLTFDITASNDILFQFTKRGFIQSVEFYVDAQ